MSGPILITGCARSGTSMISGIIDGHGVFGGETSGPTRYNARGMFENARIRNEVVKPYLKGIGVDPLGQYPLPDVTALDPFEGLQDTVAAILRDQGYTEGRWYYKGAKMCLIWPLWAEAFPDAQWIIVRRRDEDIIRSCMLTGFMRAYAGAKGWSGWVEEHKKRFAEMWAAGLQVREVWPARLLTGNFSEARNMIEWLGLEWNEEVTRAFIDPRLWHHNTTGDES